jgi:hypothetical protein
MPGVRGSLCIPNNPRDNTAMALHAIFPLTAAILLLITATGRAADWTDPCDVIWTTPSKDAAGSMPLGNGEVGINLWVEENGDLNFYISRSDSFSEISRLLKVGQVRVSITPNPFVTGAKFEQRLHLHDGVCEITAGEGAGKVTLKILVDSDQPVIHVLGNFASPVSIHARVVSWRNAARTLPKAEERSAWAMHGAAFDLVESADVFPPTPPDSVCWFHQNQDSAVDSTIKTQSLDSLSGTIHDPLQRRIFGGWLTGDGFSAAGKDSIQTPNLVQSFALRVASTCEQTAVDDWTSETLKTSFLAHDSNEAATHTANWWHGFWDRSHIITNAGTGIAIPANPHPLRIGFDSNNQNKFPGELARTAVFNHSLSAEKIAQLAGAARERALPFAADTNPDFTKSFTLAAWIKPNQLTPGRIFDKLTAGKEDGFLFDTHPGNTLRLIVGDTTLTAPPNILTANEWHHAAATVDTVTGSLKIYLDGKAVAENNADGVSPITRAYTLQRYVQACEGRGNYPIKFNGGIFTVEPRVMGQPFNADYRAWGDCFWWQNTRHMYHPMLASGDFEMMDPLFKMYESVRPMAEARSALYYHAKGCYFPETMTIWGTYSNGDYGWDRKGKDPGDVDCKYWRYAWNQGPELVGLLLDRWDYTRDETFAKTYLLPMASSVLEYFDTRFKKDEAGKIVIDPAQSVETFWTGVINDTPTVAGLNDITTRLCALPESLTTADESTFFAKMKSACPAVPTQDHTYKGEPLKQLAPAEKYNPGRSNCENPELYAVWPFRLYGLGKPDLDLAINAYNNRFNHLDVGWGYDGNCAALLGLTDEAARILQKKCANSHKGYRWPATWGPNFDWLPDQNHGGNLLETTQLMLLQCEGSKIRLLPAWPKNWDVKFELHATGNTIVECDYQGGKIIGLNVTPPQRAKDIVLPNP